MKIQGKYDSAEIYTSNIDETTIKQVYGLLNSPISLGANIRIMPDCHAGAGCVIGTTMNITDKVCPNIVGVDIGCGVLTVELGKMEIDLPKLDEYIKNNIPNGFAINSKPHDYALELYHQLKCKEFIKNKDRVFKSLGTLGGGNHFIEVDIDEENNKYLLIHSGSRNLGLQIAKHYQNEATKQFEGKHHDETQKIIDNLKLQNRQSEISDMLKNCKYKRESPKELDYLTGNMLQDYLYDMNIAQEYAKVNRIIMAVIICSFLKTDPNNSFDTVHNYIDINHMILRKGAVSAMKNEKLIIPINMRDGALICSGKGNHKWNYSAPHGAGRILSRSQAKRELKEIDFKETMKGIYTTTATIDTIDEAPMAYKPIEEIINNIGDTVEILKIIKPIYNFKATK